MLTKLIAASQLDISPLPVVNDTNAAWRTGLTIVAGIMAVVTLLLIVMNGLAYITASGEPQKTAQARQGLLYAIIGLAVIILATTIVNFALRGIGS